MPEAAAAPDTLPHAKKIRELGFSANRVDGRFFHLYLMNENGGNIRQLTYEPCFDRDPHFSHDGRSLAFCSNRGGADYQIYILDMETEKITQVTTGAGTKVNPLWMPDDQKLVYTLNKNGDMQLQQINIDGTGLKRLTDARSTIYANDISPDGRWICCFKTEAGRRNMVALYDFSNGDIQPLFVNDDVTSFCDPFFDPGARRLFYTADHVEHKVRTLYIYDFDWKTSDRVLTDNVDRDDPVISPERELIAYSALWNNAWNIYVMNTDGSNIRNLTVSLSDNQSPTWRVSGAPGPGFSSSPAK